MSFNVVLFGKEYKYRIGNNIGSGAFGRVSLVYLDGRKAPLAMKTISRNSPEAAAYAEREFKIHTKLVSGDSHANIIALYAKKEWPHEVSLFLEYGGTRTLCDMIPKHGMSQQEAGVLFQQLISGVEYIHQKGVTHCDIKPSNILIPDDKVLKIIDFGVSCEHRDENGQYQKIPCKRGSPRYGAPEVFGDQAIDGPPTDIWSCAIVLIKMLSGETPWTQAIVEDGDYKKWKDGDLALFSEPWTRIDRVAFDMLDGMLKVESDQREDLTFVMNHHWFKYGFQNTSRTPIAAVDASGVAYIVELEPLLKINENQPSTSSRMHSSPVVSVKESQEMANKRSMMEKEESAEDDYSAPTREVHQKRNRNQLEKENGESQEKEDSTSETVVDPLGSKRRRSMRQRSAVESYSESSERKCAEKEQKAIGRQKEGQFLNNTSPKKDKISVS